MTALVTPDAVEAAARAMCESEYEDALPWEDLEEDDREEYRNLVRPVLAAAAPLIAQQTLESAAEQITADNNDHADWWDGIENVYTSPVRWLTARAATLTPKDTP